LQYQQEKARQKRARQAGHPVADATEPAAPNVNRRNFLTVA
jgi:hypothetical protein